MLRAFRELHGPRLHGFALLVSLGDRSAADAAASAALGEAAIRMAELRHPERAAAWLRARTLHHLGGRGRPRPSNDERREELRAMGVVEAAYYGLAALSMLERAALVSSAVERLEPLDVEAVIGRPAAETRRLLERARRRYVAAASSRLEVSAAEGSAEADGPGEIAARVGAVAARAMGQA